MIKKFLAFCLIIILTLPASAEEWLAIANKYEALSIENPENEHYKLQASTAYNNYALTFCSNEFDKRLFYLNKAVKIKPDNKYVMSNFIAEYINKAIDLAQNNSFDQAEENISIAIDLELKNNIDRGAQKLKQLILSQKNNQYTKNTHTKNSSLPQNLTNKKIKKTKKPDDDNKLLSKEPKQFTPGIIVSTAPDENYNSESLADKITEIEHILKFKPESDKLIPRLENIEIAVFGKKASGGLDERVIKINQKLIDDKEKEFLTSQLDDIEKFLGIELSKKTVDYRLEAIEEIVFNKKQEGDNLNRINNIKEKIGLNYKTPKNSLNNSTDTNKIIVIGVNNIENKANTSKIPYKQMNNKETSTTTSLTPPPINNSIVIPDNTHNPINPQPVSINSPQNFNNSNQESIISSKNNYFTDKYNSGDKTIKTPDNEEKSTDEESFITEINELEKTVGLKGLKNDSILRRIDNMEISILGAKQNGTIKQRIQKLNSLVGSFNKSKNNNNNSSDTNLSTESQPNIYQLHSKNPMRWIYKPSAGDYFYKFFEENSSDVDVKNWHVQNFPIKYWIQPLSFDLEKIVRGAVADFAYYLPMVETKNIDEADIAIGFGDQEKCNQIKSMGAIAIGGTTHQEGKFVKGNVYLAPVSVQGLHVYTAKHTVKHEIMHALGFNAHSDSPRDIMFPKLTQTFTEGKNCIYVKEAGGCFTPEQISGFSDRDLNTLWILYNYW